MALTMGIIETKIYAEIRKYQLERRLFHLIKTKCHVLFCNAFHTGVMNDKECEILQLRQGKAQHIAILSEWMRRFLWAKVERLDFHIFRQSQPEIQVKQFQWRKLHWQIQAGKQQLMLLIALEQGAFHAGRGVGFQCRRSVQ